MSKKENELFQKWTDDLKAKLEPDEVEAFDVWAKSPVALEVYRGTVGQAELYRRMNELDRSRKELEAQRAQLEEWYDSEAPKNEALLAERDALRAQLEELGLGDNPPPASRTPQPAGVSLSAEELAEMKKQIAKAQTLDQILPAVLGDISRITADSIKNNFDIDPREVIKYSLQQGVEPWRAYEDLTLEERQRRAEAAREEERKKWIEEGRRQAVTNSPDHLQPSGPSVVDYLNTLNKDTKAPERHERVAAALKEFSEIGYQPD